MMILKRKNGSLLAVFIVVVMLLGSLYSLTSAQNKAKLFSDTQSRVPIAEDRTVLRSRVVAIDFAQLGGAQVENGRAPSGQAELVLNLFDDMELTAVLHKQEVLTDNSGYSWIGRLAGVPHSQVIFIVRDGLASADIRSADGAYHIRPLGDGAHQIQELDPTAYIENPFDGVPIRRTQGHQATDSTSANDRHIQAVVSDDGTYIDLLVGYTTAAKEYYGGVDETETMIHLLVAQANETFANSLVTTTLRLVHATEVDYTESLAGFDNLSNLRGEGDGELDELHPLRDEYAADIVHLLVAEVNDSCGYGYVLEHPTGSDEDSYAFSLSLVTCAYGNLSFAHEIGHNLGAHHDWYANSTTGSAPDEASYNHGHVYYDGLWRTVMAYNNLCNAILTNTVCTRLPYFSNPNIDYNGIATGVISGTDTSCVTGNTSNPNCDADNAQTLRRNASIVAGFRTSQIAPSAFKESSAAFGFAGTPISFTIYVTNNTNVVLENIVITDVVPASTELYTASLSLDAQTADSTITWTTNQSLGVDEALSQTFTITPLGTVNITNTAYISASNGDIWAASNPSVVYVRPMVDNDLFEDGFETGMLETPWMSYSPSGYGRVQITTTITNKNDIAITPYSGQYQLVFDDSNTDYIYASLDSAASIILAIAPDMLDDATTGVLSFWWADNADEDDAEDGVFISDDGGNTWETMLNFVSQEDYIYEEAYICLGGQAESLSIDTTEPLLIMIRSYDNADFYNRDGHTLDDLLIDFSATCYSSYLPHISQE